MAEDVPAASHHSSLEPISALLLQFHARGTVPTSSEATGLLNCSLFNRVCLPHQENLNFEPKNGLKNAAMTPVVASTSKVNFGDNLGKATLEISLPSSLSDQSPGLTRTTPLVVTAHTSNTQPHFSFATRKSNEHSFAAASQ